MYLGGGGAAALYPFVSHTFTPAGANGRQGPTLGNLTSAYSATWAQNSLFLSMGYFQGYQRWTVPQTGNYNIEVAGAGAGDGGGRGAIISSVFFLTAGVQLEIAVGQTAGRSTSGGGGGGTFVAKYVAGPAGGAIPLIIAGGGGGSYSGAYTSSMDASYSTTSNAGGGESNAASGGYGGGSAYNNSPYGGSGGGWLSDGGQPSNCTVAYARGWTNGLIGGDTCSSQVGSFGGGGGTHGSSGGGGGGGGYSGGGGQGHTQYGGGGGASYSAASMTQLGYRSATFNGYCTVTKV